MLSNPAKASPMGNAGSLTALAIQWGAIRGTDRMLAMPRPLPIMTATSNGRSTSHSKAEDDAPSAVWIASSCCRAATLDAANA